MICAWAGAGVSDMGVGGARDLGVGGASDLGVGGASDLGVVSNLVPGRGQ